MWIWIANIKAWTRFYLSSHESILKLDVLYQQRDVFHVKRNDKKLSLHFLVELFVFHELMTFSSVWRHPIFKVKYRRNCTKFHQTFCKLVCKLVRVHPAEKTALICSKHRFCTLTGNFKVVACWFGDYDMVKTCQKNYSIIVHSHKKRLYHESFLSDDSNCGASSNFYHRLWTVEKRVKEKYNISQDIITLQIFNPHYEHKFRSKAEFLSENFFPSSFFIHCVFLSFFFLLQTESFSNEKLLVSSW